MKRKYLWSLVSLLLWAYTSSAQTELPKEEYRLSASTTTISLARGQQDSVKLPVLGSKPFKTGKASLALNSPTAAGLCVRIKQLPTSQISTWCTCRQVQVPTLVNTTSYRPAPLETKAKASF